jgi:hypothetical protein
LAKTISTAIRNHDFIFENSPVRVIANRSLPEIKLAGLNVGPLEEGNEYELYFWVASELQRSGIVHFREEDMLDIAKLYKIQWKERAQAAGQISRLPEDFYQKLRRHMSQLKEEPTKTPEKMLECEKVKQLASDIVNSRMKKIVSLASASTQSEQILKNLAVDERLLYERLHKLVSEWREHVLEFNGGEQCPKN